MVNELKPRLPIRNGHTPISLPDDGAVTICFASLGQTIFPWDKSGLLQTPPEMEVSK